jgi:glutamine cyclotransferase
VTRWALALLVVVAPVAACGDGGADEPMPALTASSLSDEVAEVPVLDVEVVDRAPHRVTAWTQGLVWDDGALYESVGQVGQSGVAEIDPVTGAVVREAADDPALYAEGLALVDDELVQITWKDEVAIRWDVASLEATGEHTYEGEGWGLCYDGEQLVMSDGSPTLTFRDPATFEETGTVDVTLDGEPVEELNELECVREGDGRERIYANVWHTDTIVVIDPTDGAVTAVVDAAPLRDEAAVPADDTNRVLNGIAHDADAGTFWLTGKLWPEMYEVRLVER